MKKSVLTILSFVPAALIAQQVKELPVVHDIPVSVENRSQSVDLPVFPQGETVNGNNAKLNKLKTYTYTEIGRTYYDLQTNGSIGRRIILHADGTISAVWTNDPDGGNNFPNRGTGYNHWNKSSWGAAPTTRIDNNRTGWPSIGVLNGNIEFVMGHISTDGGWVLSKNTGIGSNNWTSSNVADDGSRVPIWGRAVSSGNTIHLIGNYYSSTTDGIAEVKINGITNPTTYSRSKDGGATWDKLHTLLPGYDSTKYLIGGGDNYAMDIKGDTVAILIGGITDDLTLWKSTDGGDNFTMIDVEPFPYSPYNSKVLIPTADRVPTNDGSVDVMIDGNGIVHCFWGRSFIADEDTTDTGYSFYPGTASLIHWAEGDTIKVCGATIDMNGDATLNITRETFSALNADGTLPADVSYASRNGNTSVVTMPSAGRDANGNLFVIYSAAIEETYHVYNSNYRDVLISYSTNGGKTWMGPQNLTQERSREATFGCMSKMNNEFVHFIFQLDELPGTNLQNNGTTGLHPVGVNSVMYAAVPVSDILGNVIGQNLLSAEEKKIDQKVMVVSQQGPNPFDESTEILIWLSKAGDVNATIQNNLGQVVNSFELKDLNPGNHRLEINGTELPAGIYYYTLESAGSKVTRKMQVVH